MRLTALLAATLAGSAAAAKPLVPLAPPMNAAFMFGEQAPRAVPSDHALYNRIAIEPVAGMPPSIGKFLVPIVKADDFNAALREAFGRANMLAPAGATPSANLLVTWRALEAPAKIGLSSHATVTIGYELRRADTGATIFSREITTRTSSRGGDGVERLKSNARFAIQTNIASVLSCLDQAAYGQEPEECAIEPRAKFVAPAPVVPRIIYIPR